MSFEPCDFDDGCIEENGLSAVAGIIRTLLAVDPSDNDEVIPPQELLPLTRLLK
jgi:hypothetical protein